MDARFYNSEEIDIERLAGDLVNVYHAQGYQAQQLGNKDQMLVQLKKGGDFEALIGLQAALSVTIQRNAGGTLAMIGQQKWIDKAAVGAIGLIAAPVLWPLMVTAGAGAIRQASLANQVLNVVDGLVRQQQPGIQAGPIPVQIMPQIQQQWAPPPAYVPPPQVFVSQSPPAPAPWSATAPAPSKVSCPGCGALNDPGDTFCSACGRTLAPPKTLCPNCKTELKPGAAFCPNCGTSTFQALPATQAAAPAPVQPTYTPPPYTPPVAPPPTPKLQPSAPPKPAQPAPYVPQQPYVPPEPQEPPVVPKPTVTIIPGAPKQETPAAPRQPQQPPTPVYKPPAQPQPVTPKPQTPPPPKPIVAKPAGQPAFNPTTTWGYLTFGDGKQVKLSGERAVVGRYDHDLGGLVPEVDLGAMEGADTVSRVHAAIEHIGSTYTLTDLNSTNSTRINGKRLEPDKPTPINDGDTLSFGKVTCTFKKA